MKQYEMYTLEDRVTGNHESIYGVRYSDNKTFFLTFIKENLKTNEDPWCWVDSSYFVVVY